MRIFVSAKPAAREESIEKIDETHFVVAVKEPPIQGRANQAIIRALAEYFNVSSSQIAIVSGWTSRQKVIEIGSR
ncbi:MAG: DUF167 domain-containing protein [bacterium]|nr:DUF167 domain-containing protein [bacterium]